MRNFDERKAEILSRTKERIKRKKIKQSMVSISCVLAMVLIGIGAQYTVEHRNSDPIYQKILKFPRVNQNTLDGEHEIEIEEDIAIITPWDEQSIIEQYGELSYGDVMYSGRGKQIEFDMLLNELGQYTVCGFDEINQIRHTKNATVYSVKDISSECVVAVKIDGMEEYYIYINAHYKPETLGEFIDDVYLRKLLSFGEVRFNYGEIFEDTYINETVVFSNVSDDAIWQILLNDTKLKNVHSDEEFYGAPIISISVNIEVLGYKNIGLWITDGGYMHTNILDTGKTFYIGEDKLEEFTNFLLDNCEGKRYSYTEGIDTEEHEGEHEENESHEVTVE